MYTLTTEPGACVCECPHMNHQPVGSRETTPQVASPLAGPSPGQAVSVPPCLSFGVRNCRKCVK